MGLTARREVLSPRLRLMVGGGSLGPRRGRLRANVSGSASRLGRSVVVYVYYPCCTYPGHMAPEQAAVLGQSTDVRYAFKQS